MKTHYTCSCCTVEFDDKEKCLEHEVICLKAEKTCDLFTEIPANINIKNIKIALAKVLAIYSNLVEINSHMEKNKKKHF